MKQYYFLCGMPRAGNTVLSAVMNQDKRVTFTANSILCDIVYQLDNLKKNDIYLNFPDEESIDNVIKNSFNNYYKKWKSNIIIDRAPWGTEINLKLLKKYIDKEPKFIILYRSYKKCLNSLIFLEKKENKKKAYDFYKNNRSSILNQSYYSIKNILKNKEKFLFVSYNNFIKYPNKTILKIYNFLKIQPKKLKLKNFKNFEANNLNYDDNVLSVKSLHKIRTEKLSF
jgi:hypothetical protein